MKKKTIFLGAFIASTALLLLTGCGKKNNNKDDDSSTSTKTQDVSGSASNNTSTTSNNSGDVTTSQDGDVILNAQEDAIFTDGVVRVTIREGKIQTIEKFGDYYDRFIPVYKNNKISYLKHITNDFYTADDNLGSLYDEVQLDNLLGEYIFTYDGDDFLIIQNNSNVLDRRYLDYQNGGFINKITISKNNEITKEVSTNDFEWNTKIKDDSIICTNTRWGKNSKIEYQISDDGIDFSISENGVEERASSIYINEKNNLEIVCSDENYGIERTFVLIQKDGVLNALNMSDSRSDSIQTLKYLYDSNGRLVNISNDSSNQISYIYNEDKIIGYVDNYGDTNNYIYDDNNKIVGTANVSSIYGNSYQITSYNNNFQQLSRLENGGHGKQLYEYQYDSKGRMISYLNYYYPDPSSDDKKLMYSTTNRFADNDKITESTNYRYDYSTGEIADGSQQKYISEDDKTILYSYNTTIKDWVKVKELKSIELEHGYISMTDIFDGGVLVRSETYSEKLDAEGYRETIEEYVTYDASGEKTSIESIATAIFDKENKIYKTVDKQDNKLKEEIYVTYDENNNIICQENFRYNENEKVYEHDIKNYKYDEKKFKGTQSIVEEFGDFNASGEGKLLSYSESIMDEYHSTIYAKESQYEYKTDGSIEIKEDVIKKESNNTVKKSYGINIKYGTESGKKLETTIYSLKLEDDSYEIYKFVKKVTYDDGRIYKIEEYDVVDGEIDDNSCRESIYTYDSDNRISRVDNISSKEILDEYFYDDEGKLEYIKTTDLDSHEELYSTYYDGDFIIKETDDSYVDDAGNKITVILEEVKRNFFGQIINYATSTTTTTHLFKTISGEKTSIGSRTITVVNAYLYPYGSETYKKSETTEDDVDTYIDEKEVPGYTKTDSTEYYQDGKEIRISSSKYLKDGGILYQSNGTYKYQGKFQTFINVTEFYEDGFLVKIETQTTRKNLSTHAIISDYKEVKDVKTDEIKSYQWDFDKEEWVLIVE